MRYVGRKILCGFLAGLMVMGMAGCSAKDSSAKDNGMNGPTAEASGAGPSEKIRHIEDLNGMRIGLQPGTSMDETVANVLPDAQFRNYSSYSDMVQALKDGKIDAIPGDEPVLLELCAGDDSLRMLDGYLEKFDFGFAFAKTDEGQALCDEFNAYLDEIKASGELQQIKDIWMGADESKKVVEDYKSLPATKGTLRLVTEGDYAPFDYFKDGQIVGYDIDIAIRFCKSRGYGMELITSEFSKILNTITNDGADFAGAGITITDERKEQVLFSDPNYSGGVSMVVLK